MQYRIKEVRMKKKLTQLELAKKSNVSRAIIIKLESGQAYVSKTDTLNKIADALGVKLKDILEK